MSLWPRVTVRKRVQPCPACGESDRDTVHGCPSGKLCEGGRVPIHGGPECRAPHTHTLRWCPGCGEYDDETGTYDNWTGDGDA